MNKNKIYGNKSNNKEEASMGMKEERPQHTENEIKRADKTLTPCLMISTTLFIY